jgi:hypothetical protein
MKENDLDHSTQAYRHTEADSLRYHEDKLFENLIKHDSLVLI